MSAAPDLSPGRAPSREPAARVTRRRAQTRARLLDAAFTVFAERGYGRASIEDVCAAAGYTRGAFYSNFSSLEELFFALYEERAEMITKEVEVVLAGASSGAAVAQLVDSVVQALPIDRQWTILKTEFLLHAARNPAVAIMLAEHRAALLAALSAPLEATVDRAALPPGLRAPGALARAVSAAHDGALSQFLLEPDSASQREWLRDVLTALLDRSASRRRGAVSC
ncbi:MAG: TetR/AcrR family transcriptional regulator [Geodermatophilaceae bacterium]